MGRKLSTYYADPPSLGYWEVHFDFKEEYPYVKFFTADGKKFFEEAYRGHSIHYANDAAENWCMGIKKLEV